jgi:hypothetical protein
MTNKFVVCLSSFVSAKSIDLQSRKQSKATVQGELSGENKSKEWAAKKGSRKPRESKYKLCLQLSLP